jgi:DNA-binding Lrp family transcriptional regulator
MAKATLREPAAPGAPLPDDGATLTPRSRAVLDALGADWRDQWQTCVEIGGALGLAPSDVARRVNNLIRQKLVERRGASLGRPSSQIRRAQ